MSFVTYLLYLIQHWQKIVSKFTQRGSSLSKIKIQDKFRKLKAAYSAVKDNNGKTGQLLIFLRHDNCNCCLTFICVRLPTVKRVVGQKQFVSCSAVVVGRTFTTPVSAPKTPNTTTFKVVDI